MKINIKCTKCESGNIGLRTDSRGIAEYYCKDCGSGLSKASSKDLVAIINDGDTPPKKAPCKFCTEDYFYRMGRMGTVYVPIDIKYCPVCGREIDKEKDRGV